MSFKYLVTPRIVLPSRKISQVGGYGGDTSAAWLLSHRCLRVTSEAEGRAIEHCFLDQTVAVASGTAQRRDAAAEGRAEN